MGIFWDQTPDATGTYFGSLMSGLQVTILLALCAWFIAFVMGSLIGIMRTLPARWAVFVGTAYIEMFRNIPLLVQLFIWFFVVPELLPGDLGIWIKQLRNGPFIAAMLGLGFYMSVACRCTDHRRHQCTAQKASAWPARPSALPPGRPYRYILLPLAYRIIFPPLTSRISQHHQEHGARTHHRCA